MSAVRPALENLQVAPDPQLLVELPPWREGFFGNLRDLISARTLPPLQIQSAPAAFWPDVFVKRTLPWDGVVHSCAYHLIALGLLMGLSHLIALQPRVAPQPTFERSQVIYYQPSEYLPLIDTRKETPAAATKADPEFSTQPIISVPSEPDNREQTIVTPPRIKLTRNLALPNIVAWSDAKKPRLEIPPVPLTPAAEITRLSPRLNDSVVTPPPDPARLRQKRETPLLPHTVVAPPPEVQAANLPSTQILQSDLIAPPPTVSGTTNRPLGKMNIAPLDVIAPAPQLPVAEQRTMPAGRLNPSNANSAQVVPPPPSLSGSGTSPSFGTMGHVIALNLHPVVGAPPAATGNRRGTFAATPDGHPGAIGSPGSTSVDSRAGSGSSRNGGNGNGGSESDRKGSSDLPAGLYVGNTTEKSSPVAGEPGSKASTNSVNPNLIASVKPPRVNTAPRPMQPESATKLSEAERAVFGNRKFYSVTLNMPNLNSAGGSWVIRFAELHHEESAPNANAPAPDLTQPMATRKVDPAYPIQLMRENVAGTVIVYAVIHADGSVGNVRVLRGVEDRIDRFASDAVAKWKFDPATKDGSPVDVEATFQIPFKPPRIGSNF
jgi:TonB family protein